MITANSKMIIPFPLDVRQHCWNALFVFLKSNELLMPRSDDEHLKIKQAELQYFEYLRPLSAEFCSDAIPVSSRLPYEEFVVMPNSISSFEFDKWMSDPVLSNGVVVLISLDKEVSFIKNWIGLDEVNYRKPRRALELENIVTYHFRQTEPIEWLAQFIEFSYQKRYNRDFQKLPFQLSCVLANFEDNSNINSFLIGLYIEILQGYLQSFFSGAKLLTIKSELYDFPSWQQVEQLGNEMKNIIEVI